MNQYLLLLRGEPIDFAAYTAEQVEQLMADFDAWNASMIARDGLLASASLSSARCGSMRGSGPFVEGPSAEASATVTGLLVVAAEGFEEAVSAASGCPFLSRGGSVEIRSISRFELEDAIGPLLAEHARARRDLRPQEV